MPDKLLQENVDFLLQEDDFYILLESSDVGSYTKLPCGSTLSLEDILKLLLITNGTTHALKIVQV